MTASRNFEAGGSTPSRLFTAGFAATLCDAEPRLCEFVDLVEDGSVRHFRSVTINPRRYLDPKSGQWKDAASYQPSDLPALLFCLSKAQEYCYETPVPGQEDAEAPGLEDETGGR